MVPLFEGLEQSWHDFRVDANTVVLYHDDDLLTLRQLIRFPRYVQDSYGADVRIQQGGPEHVQGHSICGCRQSKTGIAESTFHLGADPNASTSVSELDSVP